MENENELAVTIVTTHKITCQMISDLMCTAFEGGINYWCRKVEIIDFPSTQESKAMFASDVLAYGGVVKLYDAETRDTWILNRPMVISGIEMYCAEYNETPEEMYDNHDADTADSIVQYAVFKELMFA